MNIFKCFRKCFLCRQGGPELKRIPQTYSHDGFYNDVCGYFDYHPSCLKSVLCKPKKYSHEKIDKALQIVFAIKRQKIQEEEEKLETEKKHQENIEKTKEFCKIL